MAYAGIQAMLFVYRQQKSDKEYELMQISDQLIDANRSSDAISQALVEAQSQVSQDDPNYAAIVQGINAEYNSQLAELAAWEDELEEKENNLSSEIKQLDGYINSWQQALQTNVQKDHSYGPSASG